MTGGVGEPVHAHGGEQSFDGKSPAADRHRSRTIRSTSPQSTAHSPAGELSKRETDRVGPRCLYPAVAVLRMEIGIEVIERAHFGGSEIGGELALCGDQRHRVQMHTYQTIGVVDGEPRRNRRTPIAALRDEFLAAQPRHQRGHRLGHVARVPTGLAGPRSGPRHRR